ncbi:MAG: hypothetical protein ABJH04_07590 [Cyclobacteriaceae bacterium]
MRLILFIFVFLTGLAHGQVTIVQEAYYAKVQGKIIPLVIKEQYKKVSTTNIRNGKYVRYTFEKIDEFGDRIVLKLDFEGEILDNVFLELESLRPKFFNEIQRDWQKAELTFPYDDHFRTMAFEDLLSNVKIEVKIHSETITVITPTIHYKW